MEEARIRYGHVMGVWVYGCMGVYFSILVFGSIATASRHMRSSAGSDPYEGVSYVCTVP